MQLLGLEGVGELLRALPVLDAYEGVVREGSLDALGFELSGQPAVAIAAGRELPLTAVSLDDTLRHDQELLA